MIVASVLYRILLAILKERNPVESPNLDAINAKPIAPLLAFSNMPPANENEIEDVIVGLFTDEQLSLIYDQKYRNWYCSLLSLIDRYNFIQQGILSWADKMLRRILAYRQTHPPPRPPQFNH